LDAQIVAPLVHTIVIASCMSAPVFSEACVTAKTARGVSPVTWLGLGLGLGLEIRLGLGFGLG